MATTMGMKPQQHFNDPTTHRDVGAKEGGCAKHARVTGSDPGYGVSHMSVAWLTAIVQGTIRTRSKHRVHLIQHMHSVHGRRLGVIPSKRAFSERIGFDGSGSSRSRDGSGSGGTLSR